MLSGPTLLRVALTLVVAALLAAVWQLLPPLTRPDPAAPSAKSAQGQSAPLPSSPPAPAPGAAAVRGPPPAPTPPPPPPAIPQPSTPQAPAQPPTASAAAPSSAPPPSAPAAKTPAAAANSSPGGATAPRAEAFAVADDRPASGEPVDLNTAGVQELNRLRGGGLIGRSIVRGRPYKTVDELLTKRVLSRSVYERVRDQVTVR